MGKFVPTQQDVMDLIQGLKTEKQRTQALQVLALHQKISPDQACVWYPNIIGFGVYDYCTSSGIEGQSPKLAFAPRSGKLVFYIDQNLPGREDYLLALGKHKTGVGCVYVNKLEDINLQVLEEILVASLAQVEKNLRKEAD